MRYSFWFRVTHWTHSMALLFTGTTCWQYIKICSYIAYMLVIVFCNLWLIQITGFMQQTLEHKEEYEKSSLRSCDTNALNHCIMCPPRLKTISILEKYREDLMASLNNINNLSKCNIAVECIWRFHQQNVGRFYGSQRAQARPERTFLMQVAHRPLFIRCLAMMTQTVSTEIRNTVSTGRAFVPTYILTSSPPRHLYAQGPRA